MGTVIYLDLGHRNAHVEVEVPLDELHMARSPATEPGAARPLGSKEALAEYVLSHIALDTHAGKRFTLRLRTTETLMHDARDWLRIGIDASPPDGATARDCVLRADIIVHRVVSHRLFVLLRRDLAAGELGPARILDTLHYQKHTTTIAPRAIASKPV